LAVPNFLSTFARIFMMDMIFSWRLFNILACDTRLTYKFMKQKRIYSEARMEVVQLSGKSELLSGSPSGPSIDGSNGSRGLFHGSYTGAGSVFQ